MVSFLFIMSTFLYLKGRTVGSNHVRLIRMNVQIEVHIYSVISCVEILVRGLWSA